MQYSDSVLLLVIETKRTNRKAETMNISNLKLIGIADCKVGTFNDKNGDEITVNGGYRTTDTDQYAYGFCRKTGEAVTNPDYKVYGVWND